MVVKDQKWWKNMQPRRDMIAKAGRENDRKILATLGCIEQSAWHEARKTVDPGHVNPYDSGDRARYNAMLAARDTEDQP